MVWPIIFMKTLHSKLISLIANIDLSVRNQLIEIIHQPSFQMLFSNWLELHVLCAQIDKKSHVIIKLLNITWNEVEKDIDTSADIETSHLFNVVHEQEIGIAGGNPFGILLGQYYLNLQQQSVTSTIKRISELANYSLCPFISNIANKTFYGSSKNNEIALQDIPKQTQAWKQQITNKNSQFIYLCFPHCVLEYNFGMNLDITLSFSSSTLLTLKIINSFAASHWFDGILDSYTPLDMVKAFNGKNIQLNTNTLLKQIEEQVLVELGITPLIQQNTISKMYFSSPYSINSHFKGADISIEHILCACRFGHFIKQIARNKIGSFQDEALCERYLHQWLNKYTANIASQGMRTRYPLKNHNIRLYKIPGKIGHYSCKILLEPHMKLENINSKITLQSEIISM